MLLAVLAAAAAVAQADPPRPLPEFRADVRVIRLDVSVVDKRGRPLAGLSPEQFTVLEDGRPVEITYFEAVDARSGAVTGPDSAVVVEAPPPRRVLLLVDTGRMDFGSLIRARKATARYLREGAAAGDWVRLVNLSTGRVWDGRMPEDRARLESAALGLESRRSFWADFDRGDGGWGDRPIVERTEVDAGAGFGSEGHSSGQFLSMFAQGSGLLGMLESVLVQLEGVAGRKAMVLISPGFPQLFGLDQHLKKVATLAREAATAVYFLDSVGLEAAVPEPGRPLPSLFAEAWRRSGGAQDLAEATGGFTYRFSNSILPGLERVFAEMQTYYVVGYTPTRPEDGRFRKVKVKVGVRGATARTKTGYLAGALPRR
jgi:VWFA-related protein